MRSALVHGVLLAIMLVYGYRTWTRDKTVKPDMGSVVLWPSRSTNDLVSVEFKSDTKVVTVAKKTGDGETYWWGTEVTITKPPKPAAGSAAGSAGSASTDKETRKTHEFPIGEAGDKVVSNWADGRALRDLGKPDDKKKAEYKLVDPKGTVTVTFKDGAHAFQVGDSVFSTGDRYALDPQSGNTYVLSRDMLTALESGESSLHLTDPRGFEATKIEQVTIEAGDRTKTFARIMSTGEDGKQVKTWGDPDTKKGNQVAANFIDNSNNLKPTEYLSDVKPSEGTKLVKLTYKDERGSVLGTLTLYRYAKAGELAPGQELENLDPASLPKGDTEYFIMTEKTRVPGLVRKDTATRTEQDIEAVFSDKPPPETGSGAGSGAKQPPGNPFGKGPLPPTSPTTPPPITPPAGGSAAHPPPPPPAPKAPPPPAPAPKAPAAGSAGSGAPAHAP